MSLEKKQITIGLLWHSLSSYNLGVVALTESQMTICQAAAHKANVDVRYIIFGATGTRQYMPKGLPVTIGGRISIKQIIKGQSSFLKELEACDFVLDIGEGDSFADIYGTKRYVFQVISKLAVLFKGKPLILSPQTIGPFNHWLMRHIATFIMKRCKRVFARDGLSSAYLLRSGVIGNVDEAVDIAFRLPFTQGMRAQSGKVHIGLNVSGLLYSGGYTKNNQFGLTLDYQTLIRDLLKHWTSDPNNEVWLISHVIPDDMPVEDDRQAIARLIVEFPTVKKAPSFNSPSDAKSFISEMDFVTGARMHACIAAFSSGVAVVPLAYSRKFNGLFSTLNYQWVADGKAMSTQAAFNCIVDGFNKRTQLSKQVELGNQIANQRLQEYENYLVSCMRTV